MDEIESQPESHDNPRRSRWWAVAVCGALGVAVAATWSLAATPMYTSTATTFVTINGSADDPSVSTALQGSLFAQQRVKSYAAVVTSERVMAGVIEELGLPMTPSQLAEKIDANNPKDTVTLEISATDANPALAQSIASATAEELGAVVSELERPTAGGEALVKVTAVDPASLPTSPSSPRTALNIAIGLAIGVAVGGVLVAGLAVRDRKRRRAEEPAV